MQPDLQEQREQPDPLEHKVQQALRDIQVLRVPLVPREQQALREPQVLHPLSRARLAQRVPLVPRELLLL